MLQRGEVAEPVEGEVTARQFVEAFAYSQASLEGAEGPWGFLSLFLPDPKLKKSFKIVHSESPSRDEGGCILMP